MKVTEVHVEESGDGFLVLDNQGTDERINFATHEPLTRQNILDLYHQDLLRIQDLVFLDNQVLCRLQGRNQATFRVPVPMVADQERP